MTRRMTTPASKNDENSNETCSLFKEATALITGPRRESYGPVRESFERDALVWSQILGVEVTPRQVALCMIGLKLLREANKASRDNRVDLAGYTALLEELSS